MDGKVILKQTAGVGRNRFRERNTKGRKPKRVKNHGQDFQHQSIHFPKMRMNGLETQELRLTSQIIRNGLFI